MAKLDVAPTKSNLLALKRQLAFAEEGFDLLEQKRQLLVLELMSRLSRAQAVEQAVAEALQRAFALLQEALLDIGSEALDQAALGVKLNHEVAISFQHLMGLSLPQVRLQTERPDVQFGLNGTSAHTDAAMQAFVETLSPVAELAELQTALVQLTHELRKTQRRCNALSKIFIPNLRDTLRYISEALEERERESLVILKLIRHRLGQQK